MGVKKLTKVQRQRVEAANQLYDITCSLVLLLHERKVGWSIENPASSLMWLTKPFCKLMQLLQDEILGVTFHTCMFNAPRKKQTALWTNVEWLRQMERHCDGSHEHLPWGLTESGTFATAEECAYNPVMCKFWTQYICEFALARGIAAPPEQLDQVHPGHKQLNEQRNRAILGLQPRGTKAPPLLTDFLQQQECGSSQLPFLCHIPPGSRLPDSEHFPKGARLLKAWNDMGGDGSDRSPNRFIVGCPIDPEDYLIQASRLVHPSDMMILLDDWMLKALDLNRAGNEVELRKSRIRWSNNMVQLAKFCPAREDCLAKHLVGISEGKRFGLLGKALEAVEYADCQVAEEARLGFNLVGWMNPSGVFAERMRPPSLLVSDLVQGSHFFVQHVLHRLKSSGDERLDAELWKATMAEVAEGFLDGPHPVSSLPAGCLLSPRFGIRQGEKMRPIDDFTVSSINLTVGLKEKLQVETIDELMAIGKRCMQMFGRNAALCGRTFDLRKAYRQLGVSEDSLRFSWIGVWNPLEQRVFIFQMRSLPFGAVASVSAFLRMSRALRELGTRGGSLVWSSFFDDFIALTSPSNIDSALMTVRFLFHITGWKLSEDPLKNAAFDTKFNALGVSLDFSHMSQGKILVGNTQKRRDELLLAMREILSTDRMTPAVAESLRGRLIFAEAQVFGRGSKLAVRALAEPCHSRQVMSPLSDEVRFGLRWMISRLESSVPRSVSVSDSPSKLLFIDGACEPSIDGGLPKVSVGGVLFDSNGKGMKCFGETLPERVVKAWSNGHKRQLVFEAEVLPYLLALRLWYDDLQHSNLLVFIDNEAARQSWVRGYADSWYARCMIHQGTLLEAKAMANTYFCRVPTHSNVADGPSRDYFDLCQRLGAVRTYVNDALLSECALAGPVR